MLKKTKVPPKKIAFKELTQWRVFDKTIVVEIIREPRNGWRYRFSKDKLLVRLPLVKPVEEQLMIERIQHALIENVKKKPAALNTILPRIYKHGEIVPIGKYTITINISFYSGKSFKATLTDDDILKVEAPFGASEAVLNNAIGKLLSKLIARRALPDFSRRVHELNQTFFQKDIKSINFKNVQTRWGSCSTSSNLNFSTRLLLTPIDVQDYVIIHELAHLVEMNHSARFWAVVAAVSPHYDVQERWLKQNGALCKW